MRSELYFCITLLVTECSDGRSYDNGDISDISDNDDIFEIPSGDENYSDDGNDDNIRNEKINNK